MRLNAALGKSTLESKADGGSEKAVQAIPSAAGFLHGTKLFSETYRRHRPCRLRGFSMQQGVRGSGQQREEHPRAPMHSLLPAPLQRNPA
jgi:hypothetical protein